jgi:hypothetical protein
MQAASKLRAKVRRMGNTESVPRYWRHKMPTACRASAKFYRGKALSTGQNFPRVKKSMTSAVIGFDAQRRGGIRQIEIPRWLRGVKGNRQGRVPLGSCWRGKPFYRGAAKSSSRREWREASNAGRNARAGTEEGFGLEGNEAAATGDRRRGRRGVGFSQLGPHLKGHTSGPQL